MDYNPYAAPQGGMPMPAPGAAGMPQPWEVGEVIGIGWNVVKQHWVVLVFAPFVAQLIASVPQQIPTGLQVSGAVAPNSTEYWIVYSISMLVGMVVSTFFNVGLTRIWCAAARGQTPEFGLLFSGGPRFLPLLATYMLLGLAVATGYLMLIVPGVILALGLSLSWFYCVDAEMGPIESLKASWEATKGHKGNIFLFGLASFGVILLGFAVCCVGAFVATPVIYVAQAVIYLRLSGRDAGPPNVAQMYGPPQGSPPGAGWGGAPPGGGWGAPPG